MDREVEIINAETRKEKFKNFFINNKKLIIIVVFFLLILVFGSIFYKEYQKGHREFLANKYNTAIVEYETGEKSRITKLMQEIIEDKDETFSPLAFYYLLDNNLISSNEEINKYFDILIEEVDLDEESKNLIIFKKGMFNSEFVSENELLDILNPVIKSKSIWKPHALYLMAEYYFAKKERKKSKEFLEQIINLENISVKIKSEAQKRLRSDFSE